ncbi:MULTISPECIES: pyridoxal phosphate-dependent aminotransferase [unclassified Brevundimonas]|uniref:pyridoxal phosphate-dependent aminotransferase n=1 Tax=unclassified Brevundimonas TaxID=2622653 RepID=UPI0025BAEDAC|nr:MULTISPECIES: aminotransferase class I/II-fold pyridoxal phosphate-dependent enzyme [unclassified Brevundimonas]
MTVQIDPFRAINISRIAHELKAQGRSVIHMEFGQPSTGAPPKAIAEAHARLDSEAGGYWEDPKLRERITRLYADRYGVTVDPECVILTAGASPALVVALSVMFNPGDRIATARPGYVAYRNTLKAMHMECIEIDCGPEVSYQMTGAALDAIEPVPQGVILASPANPTGSLIPEAELKAIAEVCARKNIQIISDEIYHGLIYEGRAPSMLEYTPQATVVNSFSKYWSMPGWRLGWVILPAEMVEQARARMGNMFLTPATLSQRAALVAMDCDDVLESYVDVYRENRRLMLEALPELGLATIAPPDGAFYIYADISHLTDDSIAFCEALLRETGVATAPGMDFDPVNGNRFIRFSFAVSTAQVVDALRRIKPFFNR